MYSRSLSYTFQPNMSSTYCCYVQIYSSWSWTNSWRIVRSSYLNRSSGECRFVLCIFSFCVPRYFNSSISFDHIMLAFRGMSLCFTTLNTLRLTAPAISRFTAALHPVFCTWIERVENVSHMYSREWMKFF